jgi:hypothetical protein
MVAPILHFAPISALNRVSVKLAPQAQISEPRSDHHSPSFDFSGTGRKTFSRMDSGHASVKERPFLNGLETVALGEPVTVWGRKPAVVSFPCCGR